MTPEQVEQVVPEAIALGYRLFDTATAYRNEEAVGRAINGALKRHALQRKDVFITSKLAPADQGYEGTMKAVEASLKKLDTHYIDLYLIHWPGTFGLQPSDPQNVINRGGSWKALTELRAAGKLRAIGVSNYLKCHLEEMKANGGEMPSVNQFELHPSYYPEETINFCQKEGIFVQAYASLGEGVLLEEKFLANCPRLTQMAAEHNCTVAQILLRWPLYHRWGIIPKTTSLARLRENIELDHISLTADEISYLDNFHHKKSFKKCWNPDVVV